MDYSPQEENSKNSHVLRDAQITATPNIEKVSLNGINEYQNKDPDYIFKAKLQETIEKFNKLSNSVSEIKQPEVETDIIINVHIKLCRALEVPVCSAILSHDKSKTLDLSHHCLGPIGTITVTKALIPCKTINYFNLSYNKIGSQGLPAITLLVDRNENITHLNLSNNLIGKNSARQLGALINACSSLEVLNLSTNDLGDEEILEIGIAMEKIDNVRDLNLSNNDFGPANGNNFGSSIGNCEALVILDLSCNHLAEGIVGVFTSLRKSNIKCLNVSKNGISDEAMSILASSLPKNNSLHELDLSKNCITSKGINILTSGLKKSPTLETLKLSSNPFQGASASTLLSSIGPNLKHLDITGTEVKISFIQILRKLVKSGRDIEVLYGAGISHDCLPRDLHISEDDNINPSNVMQVLQKMADENGVSLRNVLKSIHASHIIQKSSNTNDKDSKSKSETQSKISINEFAKGLANSQILIPKSTADDIANACSKEGLVDMWELISNVKWRSDEFLAEIKSEESDIIKEIKRKGDKSKKKRK